MPRPQSPRRSWSADGIDVELFIVPKLAWTQALTEQVPVLPAQGDFAVLVYDSVTDSYTLAATLDDYAAAEAAFIDAVEAQGGSASRSKIGD